MEFVCVCAGGSGGAAHSSQRYVAAAAEAERPEREGAAAGSGETVHTNLPCVFKGQHPNISPDGIIFFLM